MSKDDNIDTDIAEGIRRARLAFEKYMWDTCGHDVAYFDLRITVWELDATLSTRLRRYEYEDEVK